MRYANVRLVFDCELYVHSSSPEGNDESGHKNNNNNNMSTSSVASRRSDSPIDYNDDSDPRKTYPCCNVEVRPSLNKTALYTCCARPPNRRLLPHLSASSSCATYGLRSSPNGMEIFRRNGKNEIGGF